MAMKTVSNILFFLLPFFAIAQSSAWMAAKPEVFAETILRDDLKRHAYALADSSMAGRETGEPGQKRAAAYLADFFAAHNLPKIGDDSTYFQRVTYRTENWERIALQVRGEAYRSIKDYYAIPYFNQDLESFRAEEVVFLGYGIDNERYSDYKNVDVSGKVILIYDGEPRDKQGNSLLTGSEELSDWTKNWKKKLRAARTHGVRLVLFIDSDFQENMFKNAKQTLLGYEVQFQDLHIADELVNNIFLSSSLAKKLLGDAYRDVVKARTKIARKGMLQSITVPCNLEVDLKKRVRLLEGENVLGYVEGVDETLRDELVVVTAHYDHLGWRGKVLYPGANDNASGTAAVLEICEALVEARKTGQGPRRSVLLMLVSGEEKGLLGSRYYVENPVFPLENTIANVNIDMIGRVDEAHKVNRDYIYVIGSDRLSTELHTINETANTLYTNLDLDYTYNAADDPNRYYYRSDHYNFAAQGIPAIFYFNGTHYDYHRPGDTADKLDYKAMERITRLIFHTTWELANRTERIKVDVEERE